MSQYLQFILKKKESDTKLCIGYFCTTPARQIANTGAFPYTETEIKLTADSTRTYIENIRSEIKSSNTFIEKLTKHRAELQETLYKCSSKEVAESLFEKIEDDEDTINGCMKDLEDWNWRLNKILNVLEIYDDNKDDWELYYINC